MNNKMKIITNDMVVLVVKAAKEAKPKPIEIPAQNLTPLETLALPKIWSALVMFANKNFSETDIVKQFREIYGKAVGDGKPTDKPLFTDKSFRRKVIKTVNYRFEKTKTKPDSRAFKEIKLVAEIFKIKLPALEAPASSPEKVSNPTETPPPSQAPKEPSAEQTSEQEQAAPPTPQPPQPPTAGQTAGPTSPRPLETDIPPMCERCKIPMVERTSGTKQKFWSCPNHYNKTITCGFTRNWDGTVGRKKGPDSNQK